MDYFRNMPGTWRASEVYVAGQTHLNSSHEKGGKMEDDGFKIKTTSQFRKGKSILLNMKSNLRMVHIILTLFMIRVLWRLSRVIVLSFGADGILLN